MFSLKGKLVRGDQAWDPEFSYISDSCHWDYQRHRGEGHSERGCYTPAGLIKEQFSHQGWWFIASKLTGERDFQSNSVWDGGETININTLRKAKDKCPIAFQLNGGCFFLTKNKQPPQTLPKLKPWLFSYNWCPSNFPFPMLFPKHFIEVDSLLQKSGSICLNFWSNVTIISLQWLYLISGGKMHMSHSPNGQIESLTGKLEVLICWNSWRFFLLASIPLPGL